MEALGWQPPTGDGGAPTGNFWVELSQDESDRISELAVAALRDVYGVQHPIFLAPDQLAEVLQPHPTPIEAPRPHRRRPAVRLEVDHSDLASTMPRDRQHLDELVDSRADRDVRPPADPRRRGRCRHPGRLHDALPADHHDGQEVVFFAAVVHDVAGRSRAAEVLNDLNVEARWVKFQLVRDRVFVTHLGAGAAVRAGAPAPGRPDHVRDRRRHRRRAGHQAERADDLQ